jgi:hypothetical protein
MEFCSWWLKNFLSGKSISARLFFLQLREVWLDCFLQLRAHGRLELVKCPQLMVVVGYIPSHEMTKQKRGTSCHMVGPPT